MVKLREIGKPTPAIDVLIAAMCIRRDLRLLTKDKHFLFIKEVEPDFMVHVIGVSRLHPCNLDLLVRSRDTISLFNVYQALNFPP